MTIAYHPTTSCAFGTPTIVGATQRAVDATRLARCPGPLTQRLQAALWQELGLDLAEQARQYASQS